MKSVQDLIDEALQEKPRQRSGKFSPSSFGMCFRQQYWNRKDEPKSNPLTNLNLRVFKAGQLFHDFIQGLLITENCQKEVGIECGDIKGFADLVTENEVVDIKSQHSKSFWWMSKKGVDIKKEKFNNWLQVGYYARELKKDFMRLVFVSKDDLCIAEYVQPLDDYWLREIAEEIDTLRNWWQCVGIPPALPRCEPNKAGKYWHCEYCGWKDACILEEITSGRKHPNNKEKNNE